MTPNTPDFKEAYPVLMCTQCISKVLVKVCEVWTHYLLFLILLLTTEPYAVLSLSLFFGCPPVSFKTFILLCLTYQSITNPLVIDYGLFHTAWGDQHHKVCVCVCVCERNRDDTKIMKKQKEWPIHANRVDVIECSGVGKKSAIILRTLDVRTSEHGCRTAFLWCLVW